MQLLESLQRKLRLKAAMMALAAHRAQVGGSEAVMVVACAAAGS